MSDIELGGAVPMEVGTADAPFTLGQTYQYTVTAHLGIGDSILGKHASFTHRVMEV